MTTKDNMSNDSNETIIALYYRLGELAREVEAMRDKIARLYLGDKGDSGGLRFVDRGGPAPWLDMPTDRDDMSIRGQYDLGWSAHGTGYPARDSSAETGTTVEVPSWPGGGIRYWQRERVEPIRRDDDICEANEIIDDYDDGSSDQEQSIDPALMQQLRDDAIKAIHDFDYDFTSKYNAMRMQGISKQGFPTWDQIAELNRWQWERLAHSMTWPGASVDKGLSAQQAAQIADMLNDIFGDDSDGDKP